MSLLMILAILVVVVAISKRGGFFNNNNNKQPINANGGDYTIEDRYNAERNEQQKELDRILDKISRNGMSSLSQREADYLKEHSK